MAFTNLDVNWLEFPKIASYQQSGIPLTDTKVLDASGEYYAWCGPVHKAGTITQVGFTIRDLVADGDADIRVETLNSSGQPSGTLWDTNTEVTVSLTSADDASVKWVTLTSGASVSTNDWIAVKVRANASSTPNLRLRAFDIWQAGTPYGVLDVGTPSSDLVSPPIYPKYSDGDLVRTPQPLLNAPNQNQFFSNAKIVGNKFRLPFDATVKGFWLNADINADATFRLYDSDGSTVLASQNVYYGVVRAAGDVYPRWMIFDSDVSLSANTWYRIGLVSGSATTSYISKTNIPSGYTGLTNCWWIDPDDPYAACYHTEASSGTPTGEGDWTDTTSQVCYIGVIITEISEYAPYSFAFIRRGGRMR